VPQQTLCSMTPRGVVRTVFLLVLRGPPTLQLIEMVDQIDPAFRERLAGNGVEVIMKRGAENPGEGSLPV
jgi:hypothetical protein